MGPVLDGSPDPNGNGTIKAEKGRPVVKYSDTLPSVVQKRLNRSRCRLGFLLGLIQGSMHYVGVHTGATWRIPQDHRCVVMMWPFCEITLTTCCYYSAASQYYVDVVCCYRRSGVVCWSGCLSVTIMSPAKTAEPVEMPFGLWTRLGPRNRVLNRVQIPHARRNFEGKGVADCKVSDLLS